MDIWPISVFTTREVNWYPSAVAGDGPVAADGTSRPWQTDGGGKWICEMTVDLFTCRAVKLARAMRVRMDFGNTPLIVPCVEAGFAPYPVDGPLDDVPFDDDAPFDDGALLTSGAVEINLAVDAVLRATSLTIDVVAAAALEGGERFSINHATVGRRMYDIGSVSGDVISIWPPLREATPAVTDGVPTPLDFNNPGCAMRLMNHKEVMKAIGLNRFSGLTPVFQEAFY